MQQQNLPCSLRFLESVDAAPAESHDFQIVLDEQGGIIREPSAAGCSESIYKIGMGHAALEIVVARRAINWRLDLPDKRESFRREPRLFDEVAGEADEIGRELVDGADNFRRVLGVAFVMKIAEVNEAAIARALQQLCYAKRGGFECRRIGAQHRRQRQSAQPQDISTRPN